MWSSFLLFCGTRAAPTPWRAGCSFETCGHVQLEQPAHCRMEARGRQAEALVFIMRRVPSPGALSRSLASLLPLNPSYVSVYPVPAQGGVAGPSRREGRPLGHL